MRSITSLLPRPHHCATSSGSVNARQTRSRGASNTRSVRISRWLGVVTRVVWPARCSVVLILCVLRTLEECPEAVETRFEHLVVPGDPGGLLVEPARAQPAASHPPDLLARDESGLLEDPHVLLDTGQRHAESAGQVADRCVAAAEPFEDAPAGRIGERAERRVEPGRTLNHTVQFTRCEASRQVSTPGPTPGEGARRRRQEKAPVYGWPPAASCAPGVTYRAPSSPGAPARPAGPTRRPARG